MQHIYVLLSLLLVLLMGPFPVLFPVLMLMTLMLVAELGASRCVLMLAPTPMLLAP